MFRVLFLTLRFLVCVRAWLFYLFVSLRSVQFLGFSVFHTKSMFQFVWACCHRITARWLRDACCRMHFNVPHYYDFTSSSLSSRAHSRHNIISVRFENKFSTTNRAFRLVHSRYELCEPSMSTWMKACGKKSNECQRKKRELEISLRRHLSNGKKSQKNLLTNACHDDKLSVFEAATQRNFYHIFSSEWHSNAMFNHADVVTLLLQPLLPLFFAFHSRSFSFTYFFSSWIFLSDFRAIPHFFMDVFFYPEFIYLFCVVRESPIFLDAKWFESIFFPTFYVTPSATTTDKIIWVRL